MSEPGVPPAGKPPLTALITGAAVRVGRAIALGLAAQGWRVAVHYHSSAKAAAEVVRLIEAGGGQALALQANLAALEEVHALLPRCAAEFGAPDCLINNASLFEKDSLATVSGGSWKLHMDVNLRAPVFLSQAFAAALPEGRRGNIINIIDQRVLKLNPAFFSYTASKAALWTVTRTMAQALAPRIRVNAVAPGPVLPSKHHTADTFAQERQAALLQRGTSAEDVAAAICFILQTPAMTGQMIALDGGQHLQWRTAGKPA